MKHPSPAAEDYLKVIYGHTEWQPKPIGPSALAARLGVAPSSVTEMVKKLATAGLVAHAPYGPLTLTDAGYRRASAIVRRHRLIETWLVHEMGYRWDEVHDEAEVLEHSISDRLVEAIDARLSYPTRDPHGDLIPSADGVVAPVSALLLADATRGDTGTVLRISDRDPAMLRDLAAASIVPETGLTVIGPRIVRLPSGEVRTLTPAMAESIWIAPGRACDV
ncbi:metal-dependent transcriptional regulator [Mycetocola manganoxydans]|uniref:Manganese transport regulator n=1 Tax=Mycetocola manganoxydans TaxID=699879 RepID=A0A3L6ZL13_9MICO|nr:metal-dependent transcriptional regulator [Mycetocola manganoxydans]RLP68527.1 metal-dependent transcriptional regulator [Mycetocola manganoxydans]GHD51947.1 transcriptional regulator [Mycetocola manganoxydans]